MPICLWCRYWGDKNNKNGSSYFIFFYRIYSNHTFFLDAKTVFLINLADILNMNYTIIRFMFFGLFLFFSVFLFLCPLFLLLISCPNLIWSPCLLIPVTSLLVSLSAHCPVFSMMLRALVCSRYFSYSFGLELSSLFCSINYIPLPCLPWT